MSSLEENENNNEQLDTLPADLDVTGLVGPYIFPDNSRRRIPGYLYLMIAATLIAITVVTGDSSLVNNGLIFGSIGLALIGLFHLQEGRRLGSDEGDALVAATQAMGFPVGHASAQLAWRGLRSRPTWRILLYSNESPPEQRGMVFVDGVNGEIIAKYVEENPEIWDTDS